MRRMFKKITSMVLVIALACGVFGAVPASAASSKPQFSKNITTYLYGTYNSKSLAYSHVYYDIVIRNCTAKPKNIKSSNSKVAVMKPVYYSKEDQVATITINTAYQVSTKISFTIGGTSYSTKVTFLNYANPAATVRISGVNSGKNIASLTKDISYGNAKLSKNQSNATLIVKADSKWKLTGIELTDVAKEKVVYNKTYKGTRNKKTLNIGSLKKSHGYSLGLTFVNRKTGGEKTVYYYF